MSGSDVGGRVCSVRQSLNDIHHVHYTIATPVDGWVHRAEGRAELHGAFKVKEQYPQAVELWDEVQRGSCDKELSIEARYKPRAD